MNTIKRNQIEFDATEKAVGRVATQAAMALQGKNKPDYEPHLDSGDFVIINNAGKVKFTGRKLEQKDFYHHSLYPGGLKRTPMKKIFNNNPGEIMKRAIYGMLPKNKLRENMMKRLTINN